MLVFPCPSCGAKLQVSEEMAGKKIRCGSCQGVTTAPIADAAAADAITSDPAPPRAAKTPSRSDVEERDERIEAGDRPRPSSKGSDGASAAAATGAGIGIGVIVAILAACIGGCGVVGVLIALLVPLVQKVREAAARTQTSNNMKQIALGVHSYHDTFRKLPPPKLNPQNPQQAGDLSWRVALLPFVEQQALFMQFDPHGAWDNARNRNLANHIIPVYVDLWRELPGDKGPTGDTRFQYFTGPGTLWPDNSKRTLIGDIPAGTSNTFLFAESTNPVPWTKPADIVVVPGQPLTLPPDRFLVAMADGSVRFVERSRAPEAVLLQYINPKDGNPHPPLE